MSRRSAWHGEPPGSPDAARRRLLEAARACLDRYGLAKTSLSDVAREAGVTRPTVYRYFADVDDLLRRAAALGSGGLLERLRAAARRHEDLADRWIECVAFAATEIPRDANLSGLVGTDEALGVGPLLRLGYVQEELRALADGARLPDDRAIDEIAEILLRTLRSLLSDDGPARDAAALRGLLSRWLRPALVAALSDPSR